MPDDHLLFEAAEVLAEYEAGHGFRTPVSVTSEQAYRAVAADIDRRSSGEVRGLHLIDQKKCIKCGACMAKCRFDAISRH